MDKPHRRDTGRTIRAKGREMQNDAGLREKGIAFRVGKAWHRELLLYSDRY